MKLIDTSAWIHALRSSGDSDIRNRVGALLRSGEAAWCSMVRLELWNGARGEHEKRVLKEMERNLPQLEIASDVWAAACNLARRARTRGLSFPATDLLIVACARRHGVDIEHADMHFDQIASL